MMTLIIGGSGSGKSTYAENYIESLSRGKRKYYIATMQVYDEEGRKKIERHRKLRSSKDFITIEQPRNIQKAVEKMEEKEKTALLECISNLTANEMFSEEVSKGEEEVTEKIVQEIAILKKEITQLIIVSNNVFEDGKTYDEATMKYIRAMGRVNEKLAAMSEQVIEVVVGIPMIIKGNPHCSE